ncbi:acyl-CoA thioesterase [Falsiroseomonas stagni]|uniref:Acyl-CoA thioester hydrolase n=1 Tax=Falsiroseomonas stagni DSM 19981 TaxID=1123062 RepID=A0A1I4D588_9PROT|nr:thioesterase family protein [Falsiroseomonas stagni]SFK88153.1 acyl-CoA thioester hydrolase [Falsiroseomonas stagni DSM 19981]
MTKALPSRADYRYFLAIPTRWMDNDIYGHVNNVTYYSYFDTVVARFLLGEGAINLVDSPVIGVVVETQCRFHAPIAFPEEITAGLRVERLGNTSIRYGIGIFKGEEVVASAEGHFVHVYVDRATQRRPTPLPDRLRQAASGILVTGTDDTNQ